MNLASKVKTPHQHAASHPLPTPRRPDTFAMRRPLFALMMLSSLAFAPALAANNKTKPPTKAVVSEKKGDLKAIRGQIESLSKGMAINEDKRADAADEVKEIDQKISVTQRELARLNKTSDAVQSTLNDLGKQSQALEKQLSSQQQPLAELAYQYYLQGSPDSLRLLLNGDNPNQIARDLHYLSTVGHARSELVRDIAATLQSKQALAEKTRSRAQELATIEDKQREQHDKLTAQRLQRKAVLDKLSATVSEQRRKISNLKRDEKQLSRLIDRLTKAMAAKPRPKREPARPSTDTEASGDSAKAPATRGLNNEQTPEYIPARKFVELKGRLRLPTRGVVTNRFGGARQEGSTWKGLFIRAAADSEVKAIASGRIVFADWMRGFGNLLIIDHGGNYLSIYGNNDSVLKQVGDDVQGGDSIAAVGNSGGNPESGLYFELRYRGEPLDPLKWVSLK